MMKALKASIHAGALTLCAAAFVVAGIAIGWGIAEEINPLRPQQDMPGVVVPSIFQQDTPDPSRIRTIYLEDGTPIVLTLCPVEVGPC